MFLLIILKKSIFRKKIKNIKDGSRVFIIPSKKTIYVTNKYETNIICNPFSEKDVDNVYNMLYTYIIKQKINYFELD